MLAMMVTELAPASLIAVVVIAHLPHVMSIGTFHCVSSVVSCRDQSKFMHILTEQ